MVRTRFAPSPTGVTSIIGRARTALFSWAYARKARRQIHPAHRGHGPRGSTDPRCRRSSTPCAGSGSTGMRVRFFQMQRLGRIRKSPRKLIAQRKAYRCWASKEDLDTDARGPARTRVRSLATTGRWRPERAKAAGLVPPVGPRASGAFPKSRRGDVVFHDLVKGASPWRMRSWMTSCCCVQTAFRPINFGVVVDEPRHEHHARHPWRRSCETILRARVNIFQALGCALPDNRPRSDDSRRRRRATIEAPRAVSVMQYSEDGYLPEALVNYLARLRWSHGDEEMFTVEQFPPLFDLAHKPFRRAIQSESYVRAQPEIWVADGSASFSGLNCAAERLLWARSNPMDELLHCKHFSSPCDQPRRAR